MGEGNFFVESLKHWKTIGAFAACSSAVAGKMTDPIDFSRVTRVVELGGGTGAITREILARMRPDAQLAVFEILPAFVKVLEAIPDSRVTVVNDSAVNLGAYLLSRGMPHVDAVISTLPLGTIPERTRTKILEEIAYSLDENGRYVQVQYSLLSQKHIRKVFSRVFLDFTPRNFPPAFFYICER